jgi:hypothetical protein
MPSKLIAARVDFVLAFDPHPMYPIGPHVFSYRLCVSFDNRQKHRREGEYNDRAGVDGIGSGLRMLAEVSSGIAPDGCQDSLFIILDIDSIVIIII